MWMPWSFYAKNDQGDDRFGFQRFLAVLWIIEHLTFDRCATLKACPGKSYESWRTFSEWFGPFWTIS